MVNIIGRSVPITAAPAPSGQGDTLGALIAAAGKSMFGDTITPQLKREALWSQQTKNDITGAVAGGVQADGTFADPRVGSLAAALGVLDPRKLAQYQMFQRASQYGYDDPRTLNAQIGAGENFSTTPGGVREGFANQRNIQQMQEATKVRLAEMAPREVMTPEGPRLVRQSDAIGQAPIISTDQFKAGQQQAAFPSLPENRKQNFLFGVENPGEFGNAATQGGTMPVFVRPDGIFNAQTGQRVEQPISSVGKVVAPNAEGLRPSVQGELQTARIAQDEFKNLLDYTRNVAQKDPTLFGVTGEARRLAQSGVEIANNVALLFGAKTVDEARVKAINEMRSAGVSPDVLQRMGMFDPNIPALNTAAALMLYKGAAALAGQSGRAVTDKDMAYMEQIVGNPRSFFSSQQDFLKRLDVMEQVIGMSRNTTDRYLQSRSTAPAGGPQFNTQFPDAPQAQPGQAERWVRGADGKLMRAQ